MPSTLTGRGAQVVLDPIGDPAKAARGAYAATLELNLAKQRTDVAAGTIADGSTTDGRTNTGGVAVDPLAAPSASALVASSVTLGTAGVTIRAGTGAATGTQPSGSIWIRTDGSAGARIYVSQGAGTWVPIAAV